MKTWKRFPGLKKRFEKWKEALNHFPPTTDKVGLVRRLINHLIAEKLSGRKWYRRALVYTWCL